MLSKLLELSPAVAFLGTYLYTYDMITTTIAIMATTVVAFSLQLIIFKHATRMQIMVAVAIIIFGLPTVLLNDPQIIKWKATVINILIAFIIALFQFVLKKNPFAFIFGKEIPLPADIWLKLSLIWMIYFIFNAFVNMVVAFYLPAIFNITEQQAELFWVNYKSYGNGILNMIFALSTGFYLYKKNPQAFAALKEMRKG